MRNSTLHQRWREYYKPVTNLFPYPLIHLSPLKKHAFTLAEVLITLGIIGVVAAMTIPGLIQNYKAIQLRSKFLKSYSIIAQGLKLMEGDDVSANPKDYSLGKFYKTFSNYLTNATDCGGYVDNNTGTKDRPDGCYSYSLSGETEYSRYKNITGASEIRDGYFNDGELMLPDGTLIFFDDGGTADEPWKGVTIYVDINGYNGKPNRLGYDFFCFEIIDGKLYAMGDKGTTYEDDSSDTTCKKGWTCTSRAKSDSDYFKMVVKKYK